MNEILSEDDLFQKIGMELVEGQQMGLPLFPKQLIEKGKKWFESKKDELQVSVCTSEKIWKLINENAQEKAVIVAIADLIASICIGVSPITVATLLSKYNIEKFCNNLWNKINFDAK